MLSTDRSSERLAAAGSVPDRDGSDRTVWDTAVQIRGVQASTNDYKIPQNVVAVCDLLPGNVHALVSNRLMPYIRLYDPSITLEFGRNALAYNGIENPSGNQILYAEAQKEEIDVPAAEQDTKGTNNVLFCDQSGNSCNSHLPVAPSKRCKQRSDHASDGSQDTVI